MSLLTIEDVIPELKTTAAESRGVGGDIAAYEVVLMGDFTRIPKANSMIQEFFDRKSPASPSTLSSFALKTISVSGEQAQ